MPRAKLVKVDRETLPKVQKVVDLVMQKSKSFDGVEFHYDQLKHQSNRYNLAKAIIPLAKECLVNHRFKAAAQLLEILSLESYAIDHFMLLAGMQVLENSYSSAGEFIFYFIRHVICLRKVHKREVLLEYLVFCLKNNIETRSSNMDTLLSQFKKSFLRKNVIVDPMLGAYLGILSYIDWAKNCRPGPQSLLLPSSAKEAVASFNDAISLPGQWDIFVVKLVEILEFYKKYDEATTVLETYIEMNPNHINAYMYIFHFLHKYDKEPEQQLKYLTKLLKQSPSDPHVFSLLELLKDKVNGIEKSLRYMFMFLDYPLHKNNLRGWKALAKLISKVRKYPAPTQVNVMNSCWKQRSSLWKYIYFNPRNVKIENKVCAKVSLHKAIVLHAFEENHSFIQIVLKELSKKYENLFSELSDKLNSFH